MSNMNMIGYRIKLNNYIENGTIDLNQFLDYYLRMFSIYEVKMNKKLLNSKQLLDILSLCIDKSGERVSFHLPKNMLDTNYIFSEDYEQIMEIFKIIKFNNKIRLITHIPFDFEVPHFIDRLRKTSETIPKNTIVLLENPNGTFNSLENLEKIDDLFWKVNSHKLENIGFCLDFGHLFSELNKEGITNNIALEKLKKFRGLLNSIHEIHLHDYNDQTDHLQLGLGMINIKYVSNFINEFFSKAPIILETDVSNPSVDGFEQVETLKNHLKR